MRFLTLRHPRPTLDGGRRPSSGRAQARLRHQPFTSRKRRHFDGEDHNSERRLAKRLHKLGVRKGHAEKIARSTSRLEGKLPEGARDSVRDLASTLSDIGDRLGGGPRERAKAAQKGARTRKRNAEKRSEAARKGAKTRAKSS